MGDLASLSKVKTFLGIDAGDTSDDDKLSLLISGASARFVRETGADIEQATVAETRDGDGTQRLVLRRGPVISVTSVAVDGTTLYAVGTLDGDVARTSGWVRDGAELRLVGYVFSVGTGNVAVTYEAGYAAIPAEVELAVIELTAWMFKGSDHIGIVSTNIAGSQTQYAGAWATEQTQDGLPASVRAVARAYRRPGV